MKRRRLLAALGTGAVSATAGCGYAPGGGDVLDEASLDGGGAVPRGDRYHAVDGNRIALATSGQQWVFDEDELGENDPTYEDATTVTVATRAGDTQWSHTHGGLSTAVALGEAVFLLGEDGRATAVGAHRVDDGGRGPAFETERRWQVDLPEDGSRIAASGSTAYVAGRRWVTATRDGGVAWQRDPGSEVRSLHIAAGGVVVQTAEAVLSFDRNGRERFRVDAGPDVVAASGGDYTVLAGSDLDDDLTVVGALTGARSWSRSVGAGGRPVVTGDATYLDTDDGLAAYDLTTGQREWLTEGVHLDAPFVGAPDGAYAVRSGCEAIGIGPEGVRWTRSLEFGGGCTVVNGWTDDDTVAFLFESGDVVWLQRTDVERGLL